MSEITRFILNLISLFIGGDRWRAPDPAEVARVIGGPDRPE
jgi:hypothetical protein